MTTFPTLYKKTSTGAIQLWKIQVDNNTITTTYGQVDGAMQTASDTIREGKNIGKSNETTPQSQAQLEAAAMWDKKRKKHYVENIEHAKKSIVDTTVIAGGILPMLAQSYSKHSAKIQFPAAVQPKLDGHRCIAMVDDGEVTLWTRTQKPITGVPHINAALEDLNLPDGTVLDGELYNHDYRNRFEELTSFIRNPNPKDGHEVVEFHVYDHPEELGFSYRWAKLTEFKLATPIVPVETKFVEDAEQLTEEFRNFLNEGYEGLMVRNLNGSYLNKRSYDLQKVKEFEDAEYKIVDIEEGRGRLAGKGIFVCETTTGERFNCKMMGDLDNLTEYWEHPERYLGQQLTVQFQGLTNASGVPRFPVGVRIREDV